MNVELPVLFPVIHTAKGKAIGLKLGAMPHLSQVVQPGQQFDLKWEWRRRALCKIEPNSPSSMLNHV